MEITDTGAMPGKDRYGYIIKPEEIILVTGANGFIGTRVVRTLLSYGFKRVRCLTRSTRKLNKLEEIANEFIDTNSEIMKGNLLSHDDCLRAAKGVSIIYHLAAGVGKSFPDCFLNSVVATRNLLEAVIKENKLKRFVNISSIAVYTNEKIRRGGLLDETCGVDTKLVERYEPYIYGKAKQDEIVLDYARTKDLPYVLVRPGVVFGPGKPKITGRIGIDTFGFFLHLGLNNKMPLTYVDNCAEAIVLAGLRKGLEREVINIIDDNLPRSRDFLRLYKKHVHRFVSLPVPYPAFYLFNYLWEKYSKWSKGQLPPAFNRRTCAAYYKGNTYSNKKAKRLLKWKPRVSMDEGMQMFFDYIRETEAKK